jgi:hypothetical protein
MCSDFQPSALTWAHVTGA